MASRLVLVLAVAAAMAVVVTATPEKEEGKTSNNPIDLSFLDISWMSTAQKKVLDNFITWYKLQLTQAKNILNPVYWNLDFVLPAVSSVITLYTGPIIALSLLLLVFLTIPGLVEGLTLNGRSLDQSTWSPSVDAVWYAVSKALDHPLHEAQE